MTMETKPCELIPSFEPLFKATCEFVKNHQGEKGYIDTQNKEREHDRICAIVFDDDSSKGIEVDVYGVRYNEQYGTLEILTEPIMTTIKVEYSDEDFKNEEKWQSIKDGYVYYYETLVEIAEAIHEYVD